MSQSHRTLQEFRTTLVAADVLGRAKEFFPRRNSLYATFLEQDGPTHVTFRGQGGEEIVIAAMARDGATMVTGSSYIFDQQIARFFTTLPQVETSETMIASGASAEQTVSA